MLIPRSQHQQRQPNSLLRRQTLGQQAAPPPPPPPAAQATLNGAGLEVRPIFKRMPQNINVKLLINTAAAGNGVVDDVDALLTPMNGASYEEQEDHSLNSVSNMEQSGNTSVASKERTERNLWRTEEVMEMMYIMQQIKALDKLNDKQTKSENVFKDVEAIMRKNGFVKKTHTQIWTKWKFLKSTYMTSRRNGVVPRVIPNEIYNALHQMISGSGASECGTSTAGSVDGESPHKARRQNGASKEMAQEPPAATADNANGEAEDSLGMAHPIFGFRLGLVKNEPLDNGYEDQPSNAMPAEPEVPLSTPAPDTLPVPVTMIEVPTGNETRLERTSTMPQRGRGRPPKYPQPQLQPKMNATLPPLRVAPFAKTMDSNALTSHIPPPPLTMPPHSKQIRVTKIANLREHLNDSQHTIRLASPRILRKQEPLANGHHAALRLSKDITVHTNRMPSPPSASYPRVKQIPMRQTPYSLRPDRVIPDLEESHSPPPAAASLERYRKFEEVPSTSHLTMQSRSGNRTPINGLGAKRRLDASDLPFKFKKLSPLNKKDSSTTPPPPPPRPASASPPSHSVVYTPRVHSDYFLELGKVLRKSHTHFINLLYKKQMQLLQMDHAFQSQQSRLMLESSQAQTQQLVDCFQLPNSKRQKRKPNIRRKRVNGGMRRHAENAGQDTSNDLTQASLMHDSMETTNEAPETQEHQNAEDSTQPLSNYDNPDERDAMANEEDMQQQQLPHPSQDSTHSPATQYAIEAEARRQQQDLINQTLSQMDDMEDDIVSHHSGNPLANGNNEEENDIDNANEGQVHEEEEDEEDDDDEDDDDDDDEDDEDSDDSDSDDDDDDDEDEEDDDDNEGVDEDDGDRELQQQQNEMFENVPMVNGN